MTELVKISEISEDREEGQTVPDQRLPNGPNTPVYLTIEESLKEAGGFGKFQIGIVATSVLIWAGGNASLYSMMYFELVPAYLCRSTVADNKEHDWYTCKKE